MQRRPQASQQSHSDSAQPSHSPPLAFGQGAKSKRERAAPAWSGGPPALASPHSSACLGCTRHARRSQKEQIEARRLNKDSTEATPEMQIPRRHAARAIAASSSHSFALPLLPARIGGCFADGGACVRRAQCRGATSNCSSRCSQLSGWRPQPAPAHTPALTLQLCRFLPVAGLCTLREGRPGCTVDPAHRSGTGSGLSRARPCSRSHAMQSSYLCVTGQRSSQFCASSIPSSA